MAKKSEVLEVLHKLRKSFPKHPVIAAETLDVYANALMRHELETLKAASVALANTFVQEYGKEFPCIAEIHEACFTVSGERARIPSRFEAWEEARGAASHLGTYCRPSDKHFSHPLVLRAAVQAAGSWRRFCLTDEESSLRARFLQAYEDLSRRELEQQALPESQRHLTAAEARYQLEEVQRRAAKQLPAGEPEPVKPIWELIRSKRPAILREVPQFTDEEWAARVAALREQAEEVAG